MASEISLFDLDWRSGPSNRDLITRLESFIAESDATGMFKTVVAPTATNQYAKIHAAEGKTPRMYRQKRHVQAKSMPTSKEVPTCSSAEKDAVWLFYLAKEAFECVLTHTVKFKRGEYYKLCIPNQGLGQRKLEELIRTLALTLGVHPYRLGQMTESKSQVFVPAGCRVACKVVTNIFVWKEHGTTITKRLDSGSHLVPGMVVSMDVQQLGQEVRAVIVTEHRNVKASLDQFVSSDTIDGLAGVIVVMVSQELAQFLSSCTWAVVLMY